MVPQITYAQIIDTVRNYIVNTCMNISKYNQLPDYFKPDYVYSKVLHSADSRISIRATTVNGVREVTSATVDNQIEGMLSSAGLAYAQRSYNIDGKNLLALIHNLELFCSTKVVFAMMYDITTWLPATVGRVGNSQHAGPVNTDIKYPVYYDNAIETNKIIKLTPTRDGEDLVNNMTELRTMTTNIIDTMKKVSVRVHPVKYSLTFF